MDSHRHAIILGVEQVGFHVSIGSNHDLGLKCGQILVELRISQRVELDSELVTIA